MSIDLKAAKEAWRLGNPSVYELSWPAFLAMVENYEAAKGDEQPVMVDLEAAAIALCENGGNNPFHNSWIEKSEKIKEAYRASARAAFKAAGIHYGVYSDAAPCPNCGKLLDPLEGHYCPGKKIKVAEQPASINNGGVASALKSSSASDAAAARRDDNPGPSSSQQPVVDIRLGVPARYKGHLDRKDLCSIVDASCADQPVACFPTQSYNGQETVYLIGLAYSSDRDASRKFVSQHCLGSTVRESLALDKYECKALAEYHDEKQSWSEATDLPGSVEYHEKRRKHFEALSQIEGGAPDE